MGSKLPTLSILVVTKAEPHVWGELAVLDYHCRLHELGPLVLVADGQLATRRLVRGGYQPDVTVESKGYIESVLDEAVSFCDTDYILRLDDDERLSPGLVDWLASGAWANADHWKFNRAHLWPTPECRLDHPQLWPDHQTRLSTKEKSGGRGVIHAGSPFGGGTLAPDDAVIWHDKFLLRHEAARARIADGYDRVQPGAGARGGMRAFSLPDVVGAPVVYLANAQHTVSTVTAPDLLNWPWTGVE